MSAYEELERSGDHPAILAAVASAHEEGTLTGVQALAGARAGLRSGAFGPASRWLAVAAASGDPALATIARLEQAHWAIAARLDLVPARQIVANGVMPDLPPADRAEVDWLTNRLIIALRVYKEVPAERATLALEACLDAALRLEACGQARRAMTVRSQVAEMGDSASRDTALEQVAQEAMAAGFPELAADTYRRAAWANLREDRRAETDRFAGLAALAQAQAGDRFGPLETEALRQTIAVTRDAGGYEALESCAERFFADRHYLNAVSCLLTLVTEGMRRGSTVQAGRFQRRLDKIVEEAQAGAAKILGAHVLADVAMRDNRYSDALSYLDELLALAPPQMLRAGALLQRSVVMTQLGSPRQAWDDVSNGLALYVELNAEADASDVIAKAALDLQAGGSEAEFRRADELVQAWWAKDLARGDPLRAAGKLGARFDLRMKRLLILLREEQDTGFVVAEMKALFEQLQQALAALPEDARGTKAAVASLHQREATLANLEGNAYRVIDAFAKAASRYQEIGLNFEAANCFYLAGCQAHNLFNAGRHRASADYFAAAERCLRTALAYYRDEGSMRALAAQAAEKLARLYLSAIRFFRDESRAAVLSETEQLIRGGLDDLDDVRRGYASEFRLDAHRGKGAHGKEGDALFDLALRLTLLVAPDARKALHFVSRQKSRILADLMGADLSVPRTLRDAVEQEPDLAALLSEERSILAALAGARGDSIAELRARLSGLYGHMATHTAAREYVEVRRGEAPDADDLARILGEPGADAAFVDWVEIAGQIWILVAKADGSVVPACTTVSAATVKAFRGANLTPTGFRITLHQEPDKLGLLDGLVAPLATLTAPDDHLILCPTGPVGAVPLHALTLDGDALLARNPVFLAPSLGVLRTCRLFDTDTTARGLALLGVLDEAHIASAEMLARLSNATGQELVQAVTAETLVRALSSAQAIHFQGHGEHHSAEPLQSCLRLSDKARLTAAEIFALRRVKSRLIVLGACEGAVSRVESGDELLGLIPAFLSAGVSTVVAAGWRVKEPTASAFMEVFYSEIRHGSQRPIEAVRTAALHLKSCHETATPYHWAAFVGYGDPWRRLSV